MGENSAEEGSREVSPAAGDDPQAIPEGIMIVPADLLSWLHQEQSGLVVFDEDVQLFVAKPQPAIYDRARLYANTIDDVPTVVAALSEQNFAVMSETGRITEIQEQDASLELLVWVVGVGVFFFGVITVFSVLKDATDRKRGTIGILRVMGVSRTGVFMTVLLRSAVIGLAAALFSVVLGIGLSQFLGWVPAGSPTWLQGKPVVQVLIDSFDLLLVSMGAIACCCLGAIPSAWRASRLDPFDAIIEGRFQ